VERVAADLDRRIIAVIDAWRDDGRELDEAAFTALAADLFRYQVETNAPYAAYVRARGIDPAVPVADWRAIPAVPASAFKSAALATFPIADAALHFTTSGTTASASGHHYLATRELYDASLLAGFERLFLDADDERRQVRYLRLVPDRPGSSLRHMMTVVADAIGDGNERDFLTGDALDVDRFLAELDVVRAMDRAVVVAGTAFAFVALLDGLAARGVTATLPPHSRVMETGGFKGKSRVVPQAELYAAMAEAFAIPVSRIVAEYGMTELCSQYYDAAPRPDDPAKAREKIAPPWLRPLVTDGAGREVPRGVVGMVRHVDLANRSSVIAIQTEDLAVATERGIVLLGRDADASLRGCSLDVEHLLA
jgi:hypothetical protein